MVFAESPCELRFQVCLTSGRCLGARVSDPPLSPVCFFMQLAPHGFFLDWKARAVVFRSVCALLIKNRPVRGGFLFSLVLRRPNSKLCRWYRTFFAILLRIPAFFGPKCGASSLADLIHCTWHPTNCTAWKLLKLGNAHGSVSGLNVSCDGGGRRGRFRCWSLRERVNGYAPIRMTLWDTWLILPVVICLSQRLSHACLSISFYTAKLQTAH